MLVPKAPKWATIVLAAAISVATAAAAPAFTLDISLASYVVKAGSDLKLTVTLTNTSDRYITVSMWAPEERSFAVDVREQDGSAAGKTRYYRMIMGDDTGKDASEPPLDPTKTTVEVFRSGFAGVQPGETKTYSFLINKLYDLSQPGKYTIQVSQDDSLNKLTVKSNTISLTITN